MRDKECWEKENRCEDCPEDYPDNRCNKYGEKEKDKKDLTVIETKSK